MRSAVKFQISWAEFLFHNSCSCIEIFHTPPYKHIVCLDSQVLLQPSFWWHLFMELIFKQQIQTTVSRERTLLSGLALSVCSVQCIKLPTLFSLGSQTVNFFCMHLTPFCIHMWNLAPNVYAILQRQMGESRTRCIALENLSQTPHFRVSHLHLSSNKTTWGQSLLRILQLH